MNIIIIANGQFPSSRQVLDLLEDADRVICCDGAFESFFRWSRHQSVDTTKRVEVVGDGDSLTDEVLEDARCAGMDVSFEQVSEQESNDLSKAVRHAVGQCDRALCGEDEIRVDILGATGLREDHTLGNISLLACYSTQYPHVAFRMVSDYGVFLPVRGQRRFTTYAGQQVSIFSFTPDVPVSIRGLRYPIEERRLAWLWEGTLNEALGDTFEVRGGTMVVYLEGAEVGETVGNAPA